MEYGISPEQVPLRVMVLLALASTVGLTIEFYSFYLFGVAAPLVFAKLFFPKLPYVVGLALSYLTFAAGFPARVLGAFIFGHIGDKIGRRFSFTVDLILVGIGNVLIALLPGANVIGILAPILLTVGRLLVGIGIGGEFGGATALLAEFGAKRKYRAFWVGFANAGFSVGGALGAIVVLLLSPIFTTIGWRIAFLISLVIIIPAVIARYIIAESPYMMRILEAKKVDRLPSISVFRTYWVPIVLLALVSAFQQFDGYAALTYMVAFMKFVGYSLAFISIVLLIGRVFDFLGNVPLNGVLSRILKRRTLAIMSIAITAVFSYPFTWAVLTKNTLLLLIFITLITLFGVGVLHGVAPVLASEQFPTKYRYSGSGLAYELSAVIGGMFTPTILTILIGTKVTTHWFYIPLLYFVYAIVAIVAALLLRETKDIDLDILDKEEEERRKL